MNSKKIKIFVLMALLIMGTLVITPLGLTQSAHAQPPNILYQAPITIYNNQSSATPNPFQQLLQVNESIYNGYITYNGTVANFEFSYANNTIIPAWIEANNSSVLNIFISIISIPANSQLTIYLDFASLSTNLLSSSGTTGIGEAPQLSPTDGEYDDGASVFSYYQNFGGLSALPSNWAAFGYASASYYSTYIAVAVTNNNAQNGGIDLNPLPSAFTSLGSVWDFYGNMYVSYNGYNLLGTSTSTSGLGQGYQFYETYANSDNIYLANNGNTEYMQTSYTDINVSKVFTMQNESGTNVQMYINYTDNILSTTSATAESPSVFMFFTSNNYDYLAPIIVYWLDARADPPNGVMPSVSYSGVVFTITFNESGLPTNTIWNVTINGYIYSTNTSFYTYINVSLPNGNYSYEAQTSNLLYSPIYGNVTVNGANQNVSLSFIIPLYNVEFNESGLPSGTLWNMTLYNSTYNLNYYNSTNTTSLNFSIPNSTYSYTALANNFYNPVYGNITVSGTNITDSITFTLAPIYIVQFIESGLPSGSEWGILINTVEGYYSSTSNTTTLDFSMPNGTYNYSEYVTNNNYENISGNFTVNGANTTVYLNYYNITFIESGLPSGTEWNIYLNTSTVNLIEESTNTTSLSYILENGNYTYLMTQNNSQVFLNAYYDNTDGLFVIQNGNFTVNNSNMTIYLNFTLYTVTFNFNESSNYTYNIIFSNSTYSTSFISDNQTYVEYMPNGTYYDSIGVANISNPFAITSGYVSPFTLNGTNLTFNITLSSYNVEFNVTGLPSGYSYLIYVFNTNNGTAVFSTISSGNVYALLPNNATYNYTISVANSNDITDFNYTAFGNPLTFTIDNNLIIVNVSIVYDNLTIQESGLNANTEYYINISYTSNSSLILSYMFNSSISTEWYYYGLPIDVNLTVTANTSSSAVLINSLNVTFYFTGNYTYDFNFVEYMSTGSVNVTIYESGLPIDTLWYFSLSYVANNYNLYNVSSYQSFIILYYIPQALYFYSAYSQGYEIISNPSDEILNDTTIIINFVPNSVTTNTTNTTITNPYNSTNNFNFNFSQWATIMYLGGSGVIMAVVGAFINPIGAFIVLGIEMLIGYELSIVDAWILFFVGIAIMALIFYSRDVRDKGEE
jgi:hypothetical protein